MLFVEFIVDYATNTESSLILFSGGRPMELLEASVIQQSIVRWRWKSPKLGKQNWGDDVSWYIGDTSELSTILQPKLRLLFGLIIYV
ncbi:FAD dependent oxidoreductase [Penicillium taxi]|uniref:FAD dependent oxidoreductase n=1 Tax=Penicillium taxi TaxID=168475 RepID=UPI002545B55C|nr:FAD dependent oxidoreductase [Penicillium taxi]KAJ5887464.1 FAD dependent oxidoreductase [Penicillium taxi]